jgi:hypothetical protein
MAVQATKESVVMPGIAAIGPLAVRLATIALMVCFHVCSFKACAQARTAFNQASSAADVKYVSIVKAHFSCCCPSLLEATLSSFNDMAWSHSHCNCLSP